MIVKKDNDMNMELPKDIANWVNRLLLGVVAFFLYQINDKIQDFEDKMDTAIINQALIQQEQVRIKEEVANNKTNIEVNRKDIVELYKTIK